MSANKAAAIVGAALTPAPAPSPFTPISNTRLTAAQLETDFLTANRAATAALQQEIRTDAAQLFANGKPTQSQLFNFTSEAAGAIDATAMRLSSQAAHLPGQNSALLAQIQNTLMGPTANSLVNRIAGATLSARLTGSHRPGFPRRRQPTASAHGESPGNAANLTHFFNTTSINRNSVNAAGQMIPLQQFIGTQIVNQFANNLGSLANAFSTQTGQLFSNNSSTAPTTSQISTFRNQTAQALGVVTSTLGNDLSLLGSTASQVNPRIQSAFNVAAPGSTSSFFSGLMNITSFLPGVGSNPTNPFNTPFNGLGPILKG